MEEVVDPFEGKEPINVLIRCLGSNFPDIAELHSKLSVLLNNCYNCDEAQELGCFCSYLWNKARWSDKDVEDFQIKLAFDEGLQPLYEVMKRHQTYKIIFERERVPVGDLTVSSSSNNDPRPPTLMGSDYNDILFMSPVQSSIPVNDELAYNFNKNDYSGKKSTRAVILVDITENMDNIAQYIDEISSIKVLKGSTKLPDVYKISVSLYWYSTRYTLKAKGNKIKFNNGMFPISYFPKHFTLEVCVYDKNGKTNSSGVKEAYDVKIKGIKHNMLNVQSMNKKHKIRMTDPTDFGLLPELSIF